MAFECDLAAKDIKLAAVFSPPKGVANDRAERTAASVVVFGREHATEERLHLQNLKKVAADEHPLSITGLAADSEIKCRCSPGKDAGKALLVIADLFPQQLFALNRPQEQIRPHQFFPAKLER